MPEEKKDSVEQAIEKAKPFLANLSFGAVMGYCSGTAMKKVGQALAMVIGLGFIGLQTAASTGYITIDWMKVKDDVAKKIDANNDGKLDAEDLKLYWRKIRAMLTDKLPSAGGFSLGFLYGVRYG